MKYLLKMFMMFIAYNGFAQSVQKEKTNSIITFPNGDESITIIENAHKNVIQLRATELVNEYEMLDLSNHEAAHRLSKKRGLIRGEAADQLEDQYVIGRREEEAPKQNDEHEDDSSGA
jgi:hypothetical protein